MEIAIPCFSTLWRVVIKVGIKLAPCSISISSREDEELVVLFTLEEITKIIFSCDGNKSPNVDEFSMVFF